MMNSKTLLPLALFALLGCFACTEHDPTKDLVTDLITPPSPDSGDDDDDSGSSNLGYVSYTWPTESGEAKLSEYYKVYATIEGGTEQELEVIQSDAITWNETSGKDDYNSEYTKGRTFSFVNVSYDEACGKDLTFRVVSQNGISASNIEIAPKSYNITPTGSGTECTFTISESNKYIIVNFDDESNIVGAKDYSAAITYEWIKHQLAIFVDPKETNVPKSSASTKVVYFDENQSADALKNADVIYFKPGYYNLAKMNITGVVESNGKLILQNGQCLYLAGGAFVEGYIDRVNYGDTNHEIRGRGILSGRQYNWINDWDAPNFIKQLVQTSKQSIIEGVTFMESPHHGVVSGEEGRYNNVKLIGWHCNNDGFRPGNRTVVKNCFLKACDDFFYDYDLEVSDCVLWPAFNGSILTTGWQFYDIGGSLFENIDIVYPEWLSMGNNKGLVMSQNEYKFNPVGSGTVLRNIRFEGKIPGFINLKPNSGYNSSSTGTYAPVLESELGFLGNITLENVAIEEQVGEKKGLQTNLIRGAKGSTVVEGDDDAIWYVKNVVFRDVTIGGEKLTDDNKDKYFTIDAETTKDIIFE